MSKRAPVVTVPASHPIQVVARRTGLSADVVRAWEKRYDVVAPVRSAGGRRLYSDDDVEHLRLLAQATRTGRTIGQVAALPTAALRALIDAGAPSPRREAEPGREALAPPVPAAARYLLEGALAAIARFDGSALDLLLRRAALTLSAEVFLDAVVVPIAAHLGAANVAAGLRASHRHLAYAVLRRVLDHIVATATALVAAPEFVVSTPAGAAQELGALVLAAAAAAEGWRVTYVGPGVPAEDIAETVQHLGARAVAVSLGAAPADRLIPRELRRLRALLPPDVEILTDGTAADVHRAVLAEIGAAVLGDLAVLRTWLRVQRGSARSPSRHRPPLPIDGQPRGRSRCRVATRSGGKAVEQE